MGSYRNLGNGKFRLYVELGYKANGKRDRRSRIVEASGPRAAAKLLTAFEDEVQRNQHISVEKQLFSDFVERWKKNFMNTSLEPSTQEVYERLLPAIVDYFGHMRLKEVHTLHIIDFFTEEKESGRKSLEKKYNILRSIFKHACEWKVLAINPMKDVAKPKSEQVKNDFYDIDEIRTLLSLIRGLITRNQLLVEGALYGGLRRGEVLGIAEDKINWKKNQITISRSLQFSQKEGLRLKGTKTENVRVVTFPAFFMEKLKKQLYHVKRIKIMMGPLWKGFKDIHGREVLMVFANEYGVPLYPNSVTQFWNKFMRKHKDEIKRIRFQDLRHSSASFLLSEGLNMKIIQKRLGHKNIKTTINTYSHVTDRDDEKASEFFDKLR